MKAQDLKKKGDLWFDKKLYNVALPYYDKILRDYGDTKTAGELRKGGIVARVKRHMEIAAEENRLVGEALKNVQNLELNKMWKAAKTRLMRSEAMLRYPDNDAIKAKLKELDAKIDGN